MALIKFYRGNYEHYLPESTHLDAIYFATDKGTIYVNGTSYGFNASDNHLVSDISYSDGVFTITHTDGTTTQTIDLSSFLLFQSNEDDDQQVPEDIGGLEAGTTAAELKQKTLSEVLDLIIFPELQPTVTAPSASLSLASPYSNGLIMEVGDTAPTSSNFTTGFNRGSSVVSGQTTLYRAGELDSSNSYIYYGGSLSNTSWSSTIVLGTMQWNYHAAYNQGPTLVTSKGNTASVSPNPLPAGSVNSSAVYIYGTYPYYCNGQSASTSSQDTSLPTEVTEDTKLTLQKWTDTLVGAKFASEASTNTRLVFDFPATKTVTNVEFYNTVSGNWETFSGWTTSSTDNKTVQGNSVAYNRLTTTGSLSGALQLRFTVANS